MAKDYLAIMASSAPIERQFSIFERCYLSSIKWAVQALQNAGFDSITDFIETVNLERFAPGTTCQRIQKFEWEEGLPKMLGLIHNHCKKYLQWRHYDISPYRDAITDVALDEYKREFKVFAERKDERKWCPIA
jgi:hypothetical protein